MQPNEVEAYVDNCIAIMRGILGADPKATPADVLKAFAAAAPAMKHAIANPGPLTGSAGHNGAVDLARDLIQRREREVARILAAEPTLDVNLARRRARQAVPR